MAAITENLPSPRHGYETEETLSCFRKRGEENLRKSESRRMALQTDLLTFQRDKHLSRAVHLQWRWQQLKERERRAQQHNMQILQEFEAAQDTLREMVACTAAMNTLRFEFERYLRESHPRWQRQLQEKTLAARKKQMEERLKESLERMQEEEATSITRAHFSASQDDTKQPRRAAASEEYLGRNGPPEMAPPENYDDGAIPPTIPSIQSSWLSHTQLGNFPNRVPRYPHGASHVPSYLHSPPVLPQPSRLHHHADPQRWPLPWAPTTAGLPPGPQVPWNQPSMAEVSGRGLMQNADGGAAGTTEASEEADGERHFKHRARGRHLSEDLDVKPVRLSSGHGDTSDSSKDSNRAKHSRERKKRRQATKGRSDRSRSDREESSSHRSAASSNAVVTVSKFEAKGSKSRTPSEPVSSSPRSEGLSVDKAQSVEKGTRERTGSKGDQSEGSGEEPTSAAVRTPDGDGEETAGHESSVPGGEEEGAEELKLDRDSEKIENKEDLEGKEEGSQGAVEEDEGAKAGEEDGAKSVGKEEEEEDGRGEQEGITESQESGEEDPCDGEGEEAGDTENEGSDVSRDPEAGDEKGPDGGEEGAETGGAAGEPDEEEEDDDIVSPQEHRSKTREQRVWEEEVAAGEEDDEREESRNSEDPAGEFSDDEEDIEQLLAPQTGTRIVDVKNQCSTDKAKEISKTVKSFSEALDKGTKAEQDTDSEIDSFYD